MDHAAVINSCDAKGRQHGFAALSEVERTVVLVSWASFEIELGGLSSFYFNDAGDYAVETVAALEAVGAYRGAEALRRANSLFPDGAPGRTQDARGEAWLSLVKSRDDPLGELDSEFYAEDPDVFSRLCDYVDAHSDELQQHDNSG